MRPDADDYSHALARLQRGTTNQGDRRALLTVTDGIRRLESGCAICRALPNACEIVAFSERFGCNLCAGCDLNMRLEVEALAEAEIGIRSAVWRSLVGEPEKHTTGHVYFARSKLGGNLIKIGYSTKPEQRMRDLKADAILVIQASAQFERELHQRFHHLKAIDEWFQPGRDLLAYIADVKRVQDNRKPVAA